MGVQSDFRTIPMLPFSKSEAEYNVTKIKRHLHSEDLMMPSVLQDTVSYLLHVSKTAKGSIIAEEVTS